MKYSETLPDHQFTRHVESYWQVSSSLMYDEKPLELFLPTCTFNIIFTEKPCFVRADLASGWALMEPGATFLGQTNTSIFIKSDDPIKIAGVRFKPFAFANIIKTPIFQLNDSIVALHEVFDISVVGQSLIKSIVINRDSDTQVQLINELIERILYNSMSLDECLRAQLNYIMDRHGSLRISDLFEEFNVSKVTLRKHFINKVGLTPKKVSQIWRMNRILQLKEQFPKMTLTAISLEAGFYDQAHFIKDFKLLFGITPRKFFAQKPDLIQMANVNISRRFTNQYDPKFN